MDTVKKLINNNLLKINIMSTTSIFTFGSKAVKMLLVTIIGASFLFSSCKKGSNSKDTTTTTSSEKSDSSKTTSSVTEDDAAAAVSESSDGLVIQTSYASTTSIVFSKSENCGVKKDTTFSNKGSYGSRSYSYSLSWSRLLTCANGYPSKFEHSFSGSTSYTNNKVSLDGKASGTFTVTGLDYANSKLTLNQMYTDSGTVKINGKTFNSKVSIKTTNVVVDKVAQQITSGTGSVVVNGTDSAGTKYEYTGVLTFSDNKKATLTMKGGGTYYLSW